LVRSSIAASGPGAFLDENIDRSAEISRPATIKTATLT
jgi:hypothetical protein